MAESDNASVEWESRYSRQLMLEEIGPAGQEHLGRASILIVGCGALGSVQAELLARAGVGRILIVDRDVLEENNLQRQVLFDEDDVAADLPKAEAAIRKLRRINSSIDIDGMVRDVNPGNIEKLLQNVGLELDGTDNFETRYIINDACIKNNIPWIYGGVIGVSGMTMAVVPGQGPCIRCLFPEIPAPGSLPTCDTAGVLNTAPAIVASIQVSEAYKLIVGGGIGECRLHLIDLWQGSFRSIEVSRDENCPCCELGNYEFLDRRETARATTLCGRNSVQISPARSAPLSLEALAKRLGQAGKVRHNGMLLQFEVDRHTIIIFPDGRVIVKGTTSESEAKTLYARYLGS